MPGCHGCRLIEDASFWVTMTHAQDAAPVAVRSSETLQAGLAAAGLWSTGSCNGQALCGQCRVRVLAGTASPVTAGERRRLTAEQLAAGERLACQTFPQGDLRLAPVLTELVEASMLWRSLREDEFFPLDIPRQGREPSCRYGLAIDLGTTHIRLGVWNLVTGERLAGRAGLNPQIPLGADILTRLMQALDDAQTAVLLQARVVQAIGLALSEIAASLRLDLQQLGRVRVVGNTAMLSLLANKNQSLLLDPAYWTQPVAVQPEHTAWLCQAWRIAADADIALVGPLGGFVGSDLLAGVLATALMEGPRYSLLVDFGTNSEMALWDGHCLRVTSAAGGPAFEGSGISCGMPGEQGAVFRLRDSSISGEGMAEADVIGAVSPLGLCGSGLVDALALLRRRGLLSALGKLSLPRGDRPLVAGAPRLQLSPHDIDVFQRAKAAIGAGIRWLCHETGISTRQIERVYACGAFGRLLDIDNARSIGLLPDVPAETVRLAANSALAGCEVLLLAPEGEDLLQDVRRKSVLANMAESALFESLFIECLYIQPLAP